MGPFGRLHGSGVAPVLEVAPIRQEGTVEGRLVALQGVTGAEVVATGLHLGDGVKSKGVVIDADPLKVDSHHLQHLRIDDEFLETADETALEPAGAVEQEVGVAHDGAPQGHHALVGGLGVWGVRGIGVTRPVGYLITPCQLSGCLTGEGVLRRAESRGTGLHVDIAGEAAVETGSSGPDDLDEGQAEERFGVLLHQGARHGRRGHGTAQREGRHHHRLVGADKGDQPLGLGTIKLTRGVGVDVAEDARRGLKVTIVKAQGDLGKLDAVARPVPAQKAHRDRLVAVDKRRPTLIEVP